MGIFTKQSLSFGCCNKSVSRFGTLDPVQGGKFAESHMSVPLLVRRCPGGRTGVFILKTILVEEA